jgi:hypothetical protein
MSLEFFPTTLLLLSMSAKLVIKTRPTSTLLLQEIPIARLLSSLRTAVHPHKFGSSIQGGGLLEIRQHVELVLSVVMLFLLCGDYGIGHYYKFFFLTRHAQQ